MADEDERRDVEIIMQTVWDVVERLILRDEKGELDPETEQMVHMIERRIKYALREARLRGAADRL